MLTSLVLILLMLVRYAVFKSEVGTIYRNEFMGYIHIIKQDLPFDVGILAAVGEKGFSTHYKSLSSS